MKQMLQFERFARAGALFRREQNHVTLWKDGETVRLPIKSQDSIRSCVDQCEYADMKIICRGWAYLLQTSEPAKRVFMVHADKVIATGKAVQRVDVRQKLPTNYDFTGFRMDFEPEQVIFDGERMLLLIFVEGGVVVQETTCKSALTSALVNKTRMDIQGSKIRFLSENGASQFDFEASKSIRYHVDSADWQHPRLNVRGWCMVNADHDCEVKVGIVIKDKIVFLPQACNSDRPDVATHLGRTTGHTRFGYQFSVALNESENVDAADINLAFIAESTTPPMARIVPLYTSNGFLGRMMSKVTS